MVVATPASAHPLGNFTINHYTGIRLSPTVLVVDHVIDMAEIPAFQERSSIDRDGDGRISDADAGAYRETACQRQAGTLLIALDGRALQLRLTGAALTLPPGSGGLETLRLTCAFEASLSLPAEGGLGLTVSETSYPDRLGWRELTIEGDGVRIQDSDGLPASLSSRLTAYPADRLEVPPSQSRARALVSLGGARLPPLVIPELTPVAAASGAPGSVAPVALPGAAELGAFEPFVTPAKLTPPLVLAAVALAIVLGAGHALTPGHGKTVVAAYLVGSRGSVTQAAGLGIAVAVSHTLGVLGLAAFTLLAAGLFPPERLYPWLGLASGLTVVAIGLGLIGARLNELARRSGSSGDAECGHGHDRGHAHDHGRAHDHGDTHDHGHAHVHEHEGDPQRARDVAGPGWRGLVALGLSGGLIPSASALLLLLGPLSIGRPAYGLLLVLAFGLGMASVLGGLGIAFVVAGSRITRIPSRIPTLRLARLLPLASAVVVLAAGAIITVGALVALI
jgi:ABC-type nickel/cobalt efflux system permease component RcnA